MTTWKSNCCCAAIAGIGWPESDICADCGEHCGAYDEDMVAEEADRLMKGDENIDDFDEFANYMGE